MRELFSLYCIAACIAWLVHICTLLSQALHETLTLGKAVFHAVGILIPLLAPFTVWFV